MQRMFPLFVHTSVGLKTHGERFHPSREQFLVVLWIEELTHNIIQVLPRGWVCTEVIIRDVHDE